MTSSTQEPAHPLYARIGYTCGGQLRNPSFREEREKVIPHSSSNSALTEPKRELLLKDVREKYFTYGGFPGNSSNSISDFGKATKPKLILNRRACSVPRQPLPPNNSETKEVDLQINCELMVAKPYRAPNGVDRMTFSTSTSGNHTAKFTRGKFRRYSSENPQLGQGIKVEEGSHVKYPGEPSLKQGPRHRRFSDGVHGSKSPFDLTLTSMRNVLSREGAKSQMEFSRSQLGTPSHGVSMSVDSSETKIIQNVRWRLSQTWRRYQENKPKERFDEKTRLCPLAVGPVHPEIYPQPPPGTARSYADEIKKATVYAPQVIPKPPPSPPKLTKRPESISCQDTGSSKDEIVRLKTILSEEGPIMLQSGIRRLSHKLRPSVIDKIQDGPPGIQTFHLKTRPSPPKLPPAPADDERPSLYNSLYNRQLPTLSKPVQRKSTPQTDPLSDPYIPPVTPSGWPLRTPPTGDVFVADVHELRNSQSNAAEEVSLIRAWH